jgi:hypothetical protein
VEDIDAKQSTGEPEAAGDERKGLGSLPGAAIAASGKTAPVEGVAAANRVDMLDENAKGRKPGASHEKIEGVVHDGARGGDHPDQGGNQRDGGDDLDIDLTAEWALVAVAVLVQKVAIDTENDLERSVRVRCFSKQGLPVLTPAQTNSAKRKIMESKRERIMLEDL